jgi:type IV pilus assembly protein PilC
MVSMVEIGERTGRLVETLEALSAHYNRQERMSAVIKNAVLYPAILLILMVAVVLILIVEVLPIFNDVFSSLGSQMSPLATNLMRFGEWLSGVSAVIAAIVGIIVIVALFAWLIPPLRRALANCFRNTFGARGVWSRLSAARFTSAMALATASGLDTEEAIDMAASISGGTKALDERHAECLKLLREGKTLSESMSAAGLISARDSRLLSIGIRSGMEDKAMADVAQRGSAGVQDEIDRLIGKIEPTLVIITSVIIGVILLSVMLPLMGIMSTIG